MDAWMQFSRRRRCRRKPWLSVVSIGFAVAAIGVGQLGKHHPQHGAAWATLLACGTLLCAVVAMRLAPGCKDEAK